MSEPEINLTELISKRGVLKRHITMLQKLAHSDKADKIRQLETRLTKCDEWWNEFQYIQGQIEYVDSSEEQYEQRDSFQESYFEVVAFAKHLVKETQAPVINLQSSQPQGVRVDSSEVRLAPIEIPKFDGSYNKWLGFWDAFNTMIESNQKLSAYQKFAYLQKSLTGQAASVIEDMTITESNYKDALDLLKSTYENKKVITYSHLEALDDLEIRKGTYENLNKFLNDIRKNLRCLKNLGHDLSGWETYLVFHLQKKLDIDSKKEWKKGLGVDEFPKLDQFLDFLIHRCKLLEPENVNTNFQKLQIGQNYKTGQNKYFNKSSGCAKTFLGVESNVGNQCSLCKSNEHYRLQDCQKFISLPLEARRNEVSKINMCWNCLRQGHKVYKCLARGCKHCGRKHHSLLHSNQGSRMANDVKVDNSIPLSAPRGTQEDTKATREEGVSLMSHCTQKGEVLLSTALVEIEDVGGNYHICRALLDSGSMSSFITKDLKEKLRLTIRDIKMSIKGIGSGTTKVNSYVTSCFKSRCSGAKFKTDFLIIDKISERVPCLPVDITQISIPEDFTLADQDFANPGKIDLLIGSAVFWELLGNKQHKLGPGKPILQQTSLGWVVVGEVNALNSRVADKVNECFLVSKLGVQDQLEKFWKIEEVTQGKLLSKEGEKCEDNFRKTTRRDQKGKFIVTLPFKENGSMLGNSAVTALSRLKGLENKFAKNIDFEQRYKAFLEEYLQLGHMTCIKSLGTLQQAESFLKGNFTDWYFLPHHGVLKESSETTKLRVVFDASAPTDNGVSLNNILSIGPKLQEDLFHILLRFREYQIIIAADIEKMYRQVLVAEHDRKFQNILWRRSSDQTICVFQLNTVTYGTASAAYLAVRSLHQLAYEHQDQFPSAAETILKDFYMDDWLGGAETIKEAIILREEVSQILKSGGFVLRKWMSNSSEVLPKQNSNSDSFIEHYIAESSTDYKTLGLFWNSIQDVLHFVVTQNSDFKVLTKRVVLSAIARIFDPLGLVGAVVIKAKLFLQELWKMSLKWDDKIPSGFEENWTRFYEGLEELNNLKIPRRVICQNSIDIEIHCFCDSSQSAYGACIYIVSTDKLGNRQSRLLCSKSRVAPLKVVSLPRLELCGALLAANLSSEVLKAIRLKPREVYYWCDSTIVLAWLASEPTQWKVFVANRTSEIQKLTEGFSWHHVMSKDNPADLISRGIPPDAISSCRLWWEGPKWLISHKEQWPQNSQNESKELPERRTVICQTFLANELLGLFEKYSSFCKLQRVIAFCIRFGRNCRKENGRRLGSLSVKELEYANSVLDKLCQSETFEQEINYLRKRKNIPKNSPLLSLNPFLDSDGILRVGGRLENTNLSFEQRHPVILPKKHIYTEMLIMREHLRNLHVGPQALLGIIRLRYWPLGGLNLVKCILRKCLLCVRLKPKIYKYIQGNLPRDRITPSRPFTNCGVDFGGPFEIKVSKSRGHKRIKAYLCVFVCFATKAVHLEAVSDLTSESFLNCFKRFIARRGLCSNIYSDNATNFVGSNNYLQDLRKFLNKSETKDSFMEYFADKHINWHFIPPRSPHFGGLWEAAIKSVKFHLKRVVGCQALTFEELQTVFAQIEACLNSRPLCPLTEDPESLNSLTPGHFLIGHSLISPPQEDLSDQNISPVKRYHLLTKMVQDFWRKWSKEYLHQLQQRHKWQYAEDSIKVGDLVVLKEDNTPPMYWRLGRIQALHTGLDNECRVVSVKTGNGVLKRALNRVCVLPIEH